MRSQLFEGISNDECVRMFNCFGARRAHFASGDVICEFNGARQEVGILQEGSADLVRVDAGGNRTILESLEEGSVFGEVLAFSGTVWDSVFVECRQDCSLIFLNYDQITKRCENACTHHSVLVQNLFRLLSAKTIRLSERVEVLSRRTIRDKLLCCFSQMMQREHSSTLTLPYSLSALADYISVDRSAMMRELKKMREEGIIRTENRRVTLLVDHKNMQ